MPHTINQLGRLYWDKGFPILVQSGLVDLAGNEKLARVYEEKLEGISSLEKQFSKIHQSSLRI
jgi:hypothetical protein